MSDAALGKRVENSHIWDRQNENWYCHRATEIGSAGEYIVCADLILQGYRAFPSAQGLPYDVVAEIDGALIRVAVKSTLAPRSRPARERSRICYQFNVGRTRRRSTGQTDHRAYDPADIDLVALCALDSRRVAYCSFVECARAMHIDAPGEQEGEIAYVTGRQRKTFAQYTLDRALSVHFGRTKPNPIRGRATA